MISDTAGIEHGSWQYWEAPSVWTKNGWDGAWTREELNHPNGHILNFAVADGRQVKSAIGNQNFDPNNPSLTEHRRSTGRPG